MEGEKGDLEKVVSDEASNKDAGKLIDLFEQGDIDAAGKIITELKPSEEVIQSAEVQSAAKARVIECLEYGNTDSIRKIITRFKLSEEFV